MKSVTTKLRESYPELGITFPVDFPLLENNRDLYIKYVFVLHAQVLTRGSNTSFHIEISTIRHRMKNSIIEAMIYGGMALSWFVYMAFKYWS